MKYTVLGGAIAASIIALPAQAQETPLVITITGTRTEVPLEETLAATTVITREEIERTGAQSVQQVLQAQPGITLSRQGGLGAVSGIFMRGTNANHVLVLIDGVRHSSATAGTPAIEQIPLAQIERIEIVRGPRSALYGSDAIGGVIQIFTRKGEGEFNAGVSVGYGSNNTREITAFAQKGGSTYYNLSVSHLDSDGINATKNGNFSFEPDDDGYTNNSVSIRAGHRYANGARAEAHFLRAEGETEYDEGAGSFPTSETVQQIAGLDFEMPVNELWTTRLQLAESRDESEARDSFFPGTFNTRRQSANWQNNITFNSDQTFTFGADYYRDKVDSTEDYSVDDVDTVGFYLQHQARFIKHNLIAGLRREDHDSFGSKTTGNLSWAYDLFEEVQFGLSYGTGFATPSFNELYWPQTGFYVGNPDLDPEESRSFEISLDGDHDWGNWRISAYHTNIDNLLVYVYNADDPSQSRTENVNEARISGVETSLGVKLGEWNVNTSLSLTSPEDANSGAQLPRRPRKSFRVDADRMFGQANVGFTALAEGPRYDDAGNFTRIPGYGILNLRAGYAFSKQLSVEASVDNVFDKDYETAANYNSPGREAFLRLKYSLR